MGFAPFGKLRWRKRTRHQGLKHNAEQKSGKSRHDFWKLWYGETAPRCGAKHMFKFEVKNNAMMTTKRTRQTTTKTTTTNFPQQLPLLQQKPLSQPPASTTTTSTSTRYYNFCIVVNYNSYNVYNHNNYDNYNNYNNQNNQNILLSRSSTERKYIFFKIASRIWVLPFLTRWISSKFQKKCFSLFLPAKYTREAHVPELLLAFFSVPRKGRFYRIFLLVRLLRISKFSLRYFEGFFATNSPALAVSSQLPPCLMANVIWATAILHK